ncbi:MAG: hypothetical protein FWE98_07870 [Oscillospiraceae bacterium]|nr:hypothetical protein [Oscillospiraceae bacterium]
MKSMKSSFSLALAALMLLLALPLAARAAAQPCACDTIVQLMVMGNYATPMYYADGDEQGRQAMLPMQFLMNERGESRLPITRKWEWEFDAAQDHRENPEYYFVFDYRVDQFENAQRLHEFVEAVCLATGHEKVAMTSTSQANSVMMTYLKEHGYGRARSLMFYNGSFQGTTFMGEALTDFQIGSLADFAEFLACTKRDSEMMAASMNLLTTLPGANRALRLPPANRLAEALAGRVIKHMPYMWTFFPAGYYEQVRDKLLVGPQYDYLRARLDKYHNEVQLHVPELLANAQKAGVKVAVVACYGVSAIPLTAKTDYQNDSLVDVAYSSVGATVAPIGQVLPPGDSPYRSPDGIIDAASCVLPDKTWFVKYKGHWWSDDVFREFQQWFIHSDGHPTVNSNPVYPQFMYVGDGELHALADEPERPPLPDTFVPAMAALLRVLAG